jgi:hypothetical protein
MPLTVARPTTLARGPGADIHIASAAANFFFLNLTHVFFSTMEVVKKIGTFQLRLCQFDPEISARLPPGFVPKLLITSGFSRVPIDLEMCGDSFVTQAPTISHGPCCREVP